MELLQKRLELRTKELHSYETKFNLLKTRDALPEITDIVLDPNINYLNDNCALNFFSSKLKTTKYNLNLILKKELEDYDFNNYKLSNNNLKSIEYLFNRYNSLINSITEDKWILYQNNQTKYELKADEFVIDNSVSIKDKNNPELIYYLKKLIKICKILAKTQGYNVFTKFYDDDYHEICWLIFVFTKN
jgi:hypothetical protein